MCRNEQKLIGFYTGYNDAKATPARLLDDDIICDFVVLSVSTTADDLQDTAKDLDDNFSYQNAGEEIYWGFETNPLHQLFPGQFTNYIPVKSARDIFVRSNQTKGATSRVVFSCYKYIGLDESV